MILLDDELQFSKAVLEGFRGVIDTGVIKLMSGDKLASPAVVEPMHPLATLPVTSLVLEVTGSEIRMTGAPKFSVLRTGTISWFMIDCRAANKGYMRGDVSFTGSPSVLRASAELQLNTLLISAGDGGALSEITPIQFSIKLG